MDLIEEWNLSKRRLQEMEMLKNSLEQQRVVQDYLNTVSKIKVLRNNYLEKSKQVYKDKMKNCSHLFVTNEVKEKENIRKICLKCGFDTSMIGKSGTHPFLQAINEMRDYLNNSSNTIYQVSNFERVKKLYLKIRRDNLTDDEIFFLLKEMLKQ